jgi:hypothetical protein
LLFFYLGAVGVREHSRVAAAVMFISYVIDTLASFKLLEGSPGMIVLRVIITALLLSNLRASWIAAHWQSTSDQASMRLRLSDTLLDRFANRWPSWVWPKTRVVDYILSIGVLLVVGQGLAVIALLLSRG